MSIKYIRCTRCGGDLTKKGEAYVCQYCNAAFVEDFISQNEKIIEQFLDELKLEKVSALRQQLYEKTHAKYLSRNEILETAKAIRSYLPEDFLARFYESACSKNKQDVIDFIQSIDYEYNYANLDLVIEFMIKNLNSENLLAVSNLIENAYKENCIELYSKFTNAYEKEAEKIDKGIYERIIPRDVFIAYSSKDMKVVEEITQYLESQGITCFVALRNLRHGVGAVEDYDKALEEAIDNCKIFLFVSSKNSRNMACDALKKEITYVKRIDLKDAPIQYKNNYVKLPKKYKKPRIQLRLDNVETRIADRIVNEFFDGYEWCYDKDAIIDRISDIMFNFETDTEEQEEQKKLEDDLKKQQEELKKKEEEIQKSKNKKY
nr:toll/interleukin-1 receptor domain-containing protein [Clostridia bacterium]